MRAADYLREKRRMCNSFNYCSDCPFKDTSCNETENKNPEKAEEIVETWAKENPIMTNADKLKRTFGISAQDIWGMTVPEFSNWLKTEYKCKE